MIKLLYFAALVDMLGSASETLAAPLPSDVRALVALLKQRGGAWEQVFGQRSVRITVNKQFAELDTPLKDGDEVAFISAWI
jgi:molybdopterin synthase sulfur carrier subunit